MRAVLGLCGCCGFLAGCQGRRGDRVAAVIVLSGRSTRPAMSQPIAAAATAMTARAMAQLISSCLMS